jgi:hypothetical protein
VLYCRDEKQVRLAMLKHPDDPRKEPAKSRAQRRWKNHAVEKAFKAAKQEADGEPPDFRADLSPADVIEQEKLIKESTTKFESKFIKEIRSLFDEHKRRNLVLYALSIKAQRKRLLMEKLRRLEAREAQRITREGVVLQTQLPIKRDLFS